MIYKLAFSVMYAAISCSVTLATGCLTINAIGNSPASVSGKPVTAASFTDEC